MFELLALVFGTTSEVNLPMDLHFYNYLQDQMLRMILLLTNVFFCYWLLLGVVMTVIQQKQNFLEMNNITASLHIFCLQTKLQNLMVSHILQLPLSSYVQQHYYCYYYYYHYYYFYLIQLKCGCQLHLIQSLFFPKISLGQAITSNYLHNEVLQ